jgi:hypothetical protein
MPERSPLDRAQDDLTLMDQLRPLLVVCPHAARLFVLVQSVRESVAEQQDVEAGRS